MTKSEQILLALENLSNRLRIIEAKMGIRPKELTGRKRIETIAEREARIVIGKK